MPLKQKSNEKMHRRHLEEVPFYKLRHTFDELPLDPVKPFIIEKMREFSSFLPISFEQNGKAIFNLKAKDVRRIKAMN